MNQIEKKLFEQAKRDVGFVGTFSKDETLMYQRILRAKHETYKRKERDSNERKSITG